MSKDELIDRICPVDVITDCCTGEADFGCDDCKLTLENLLNEFSRQIRADAIDELKDAIVNKFTEYDKKGYIDHTNAGIKNKVAEIAEQLKEKEE